MDEAKIEIDAAFEHYRRVGFPYPILAPHEIWHEFFVAKEIELQIIARQPALFDGANTHDLEIRHEGLAVANFFHPHIWESHAIGMSSPLDAFMDDTKLYHAIELARQTNGQITDAAVRNKLKIVHGTQMCSNFRPTAARAIYRALGTGPRVLDPSAGYGGRLLGFLLLDSGGEYCGVDPNPRTCDGNINMATFFGQSERVSMVCKPMEDTTSEDLPGEWDFAFTSPPYFRKEIYDTDPLQSCNRYTDYQGWLDSFWFITLQKVYDKIRTDGRFVVNVSDVNIRGKSYPLLADTKAGAENAGWHLEEELTMRFSGFGASLDKFKSEAVLVFQKPA